MFRQRRPKVILDIEAGETGLGTRKLILETFGYNVLAASSAHEAVPLLSEHRIHAAILDDCADDIPLPQLSAQIKAKHHIPIVLVGDTQFIPHELQQTVDKAIEKLHDPKEIIQVLDELLDIKDVQRENGGDPYRS